jgi:Concanavalin A-like lectin/glucanases superfamily
MGEGTGERVHTVNDKRKKKWQVLPVKPSPQPSPKGIHILDLPKPSYLPPLARPGSPKGCKIVAGGRRPPDHDPKMIRHLEEVQDVWHPSGVRMTVRFPPEVFALLRPPATSWQPCGLQKRLVVSLWTHLSAQVSQLYECPPKGRGRFLLLATLALVALSSSHAQKSQSTTWQIDSIKLIGTHAPTILGSPQAIQTPTGKAVLFNGSSDGLIVDENPVAGLKAFTVEAIFRPDPGGAKEQRWLHIQGDPRDDRVLLEIRVDGDQWFLDTFIKSSANSRALYSENFKHPLGQWYHVALVFDGSMMRDYVDGKEELSGPLEIAPLDNGKTSLGVRMNRVYWFKGAIAKARFTPRALAPKEFMKR